VLFVGKAPEKTDVFRTVSAHNAQTGKRYPRIVRSTALVNQSYDLRRLRLHGLIERIPRTHRYRLTPFGLLFAIFFTRTDNRLLRPGLARIAPVAPARSSPSTLCASFDRLQNAVDHWCDQAKLAGG
jgi:hypothetical protein